MLPYPERMRRRAHLVRAVRAFFDARDFLEVDTPVAQTSLAPEVHLEAPKVELTSDTRRTRYLQTSPELCMKRLLAQGLPRIYQIAPAFRDGDFSPRHRPEFRILEWYRTGDDWQALMRDCEDLLTHLTQGQALTYAGQSLVLDKPFRRLPMDAAFREHAGFSILGALERPQLAQELTRLGLRFTSDDSWDDLFHRVFLTLVEPAIMTDLAPVFLTHYPAPLAALARLSQSDPRVAERFELYLGGLELANAFSELTDVAEQRRRFAHDRELRLAAGKHDYPADERFFQALTQLPPSAGIALGLDRLLMLLLDAPNLDGTAFLPWSET